MFKIFFFTLKNNLKAVWMSASVIIITIVIASVLGSAIAKTQETGIYSKEVTAVYNNLSSPYKEALNELLEDDNLSEIMVYDVFENKEDMNDLIENRQYNTTVIAENINGKDRLIIESSRDDSFMFTIGLNFTNTVNTISLISKTNDITPDMHNQYDSSTLQKQELEKGYPAGINYYGIQSLIQMTALLAVLGVFSVLDDKNKNIFPRIHTSPLSRFKVSAGRLLANVVYMVLIQIIIVVLLVVFMDVNWGTNYLLIVVVFALYSVCVTCLGMISAVLTKSVMASIGIILGIGSTIWPRFSGAFSPYYNVGPLAYTSPSFHVKNILFSSIYGGSQNAIIEGLLWLAGITLFFIAAYALTERLKKDESI